LITYLNDNAIKNLIVTMISYFNGSKNHILLKIDLILI